MKKFDNMTRHDYNVNCAETVRNALRDSGITIEKAGEAIGCSRQSLTNKLARNAISAKDYYALLRLAGKTVEVVPIDEETPNPPPSLADKGMGPDVSKMVNGIRCDTKAAEFMASDFTRRAYPDGIEHHFAYELYRKPDGQHFVVVHSVAPGCPPHVFTVTDQEAVWYYENNTI